MDASQILQQALFHRQHSQMTQSCPFLLRTLYGECKVTTAQLEVYIYAVKVSPGPFLGFQKMVYSLNFYESTLSPPFLPPPPQPRWVP